MRWRACFATVAVDWCRGSITRAVRTKCLTRGENPIAEILCVDDPRQLHVMRLTGAVARGLKLDGAQVEAAKHRALNERDVLDVLKGDRLLDLEEDALAEPQRAVGKLALQQVVVVPRPPLPHAAEPDERHREGDDGDYHRETDRDDEVRPVERVKPGSMDDVRCWGFHRKARYLAVISVRRTAPRHVTYVRQLLELGSPRSKWDAGRERRQPQVFAQSATCHPEPPISGRVFDDAKLQ